MGQKGPKKGVRNMYTVPYQFRSSHFSLILNAVGHKNQIKGEIQVNYGRLTIFPVLSFIIREISMFMKFIVRVIILLVLTRLICALFCLHK